MRAIRKACVVCGRPSRESRCPDHRRTPGARKPPAYRTYRGTARFRRVRELVWERDGGRCGRCGRLVTEGEKWDLGHLVPHHQGGPFEADNLRVEHVGCNRAQNHR